MRNNQTGATSGATSTSSCRKTQSCTSSSMPCPSTTPRSFSQTLGRSRRRDQRLTRSRLLPLISNQSDRTITITTTGKSRPARRWSAWGWQTTSRPSTAATTWGTSASPSRHAREIGDGLRVLLPCMHTYRLIHRSIPPSTASANTGGLREGALGAPAPRAHGGGQPRRGPAARRRRLLRGLLQEPDGGAGPRHAHGADP